MLDRRWSRFIIVGHANEEGENKVPVLREKGRETMLRFIRVSVKKERLVRRREARREGGMP